MKTLQLTLIVIFATICLNTLHAQKVPYEKLDSLSSVINKLQLETDDKIYIDGSNSYEISFPEKNFEISFSTQLATHALYKKLGSKEVLALTQNIDLSKAIGITNWNDDTRLIVTKLYFPTGYLKTKKIENGNLINTVSEGYLEFFCMDENKNVDRIFNSLLHLCTKLKKEKGLITEREIEEQLNDWEALSEKEYIEKHPNSLMTMQAKSIVKYNEEKKNKSKRITDSIINVSKFKLLITKEEFKKLYPESESIFLGKRYKYDGGYFYYLKQNSGLATVFFRKNIVNGYAYQIKEFKTQNEAKAFYIEYETYFDENFVLIEPKSLFGRKYQIKKGDNYFINLTLNENVISVYYGY